MFSTRINLDPLASSSGWSQGNRLLVRSYSVHIIDHHNYFVGYLTAFVDDSDIKFYFVDTRFSHSNSTLEEQDQYTNLIPNSVTTNAILGPRVLISYASIQYYAI